VATVEQLAAEARRLKGIPDPSEVVVVRPKFTWSGTFGTLVGTAVALLIRGAIVSWAATKVEIIPDFGYVEAVFLCLFTTHLLHWGGRSGSWTRGWPQRARGAYDRAHAALKRAMKNAVDKAAEK